MLGEVGEGIAQLSAHLHAGPQTSRYVVFSKGAPLGIL